MFDTIYYTYILKREGRVDTVSKPKLQPLYYLANCPPRVSPLAVANRRRKFLVCGSITQNRMGVDRFDRGAKPHVGTLLDRGSIPLASTTVVIPPSDDGDMVRSIADGKRPRRRFFVVFFYISRYNKT